MLGNSWEDCVEIHVLRADAVDLLVHGNLSGEDHEASSVCGGEEL